MRKLMILAAMLAMMLVAAAPAFAQTQTATGGNVTIGGPSVKGNNNVVAQSQNVVNVSGNVVQQRSTQQQTSTNVAIAAVINSTNSSATATAASVQSSNQSGITIGDVSQSCSIALANAR